MVITRRTFQYYRAGIRPEQIRQAQRLLNELPIKDNRKTREEAAGILEKEFRKAFKKGYTPQELSMMLKNAGIIIPAYLTEKILKVKNGASQPHKKPTKAKPEADANPAPSIRSPDIPLEKL